MRARQWAPEIGTFLSVDEYGSHELRTTLWGWPNENQVAESILVFLHSLLELRLAGNVDHPNEQTPDEHSSLGPISLLQASPSGDPVVYLMIHI